MTTLCGGLDSASFLPSNMTRPYAIIDKNKIKSLLPSLVLKVTPVWYDQTTEVGIIWEQSRNDSAYLQAQSLAQVAVLVAHKEVADRVKTVLSTLLCHCHQSSTGSLVERKWDISSTTSLWCPCRFIVLKFCVAFCLLLWICEKSAWVLM